jgi:hypothetical protein
MNNFFMGRTTVRVATLSDVPIPQKISTDHPWHLNLFRKKEIQKKKLSFTFFSSLIAPEVFQPEFK